MFTDYSLCLNKFLPACVPQMFYCRSGIDDCGNQELSLNCDEIFLFVDCAINLPLLFFSPVFKIVFNLDAGFF